MDIKPNDNLPTQCNINTETTRNDRIIIYKGKHGQKNCVTLLSNLFESVFNFILSAVSTLKHRGFSVVKSELFRKETL